MDTYEDKPFLYPLHSGEAFGDGGLVIAMFCGLALVLITISGFYIYLTMRRPGRQGIKRFYWWPARDERFRHRFGRRPVYTLNRTLAPCSGRG